MPGQQRVRLDVEPEAIRNAISPQRHLPLGRGRVVGRVDLGQRELRGVVAKPLLGRHRPLRIPVSLLDQRSVGPGATTGKDDVLAGPGRRSELVRHALSRLRTAAISVSPPSTTNDSPVTY